MNSGEIEFVADPEVYDRIAKPRPASDELPEWFTGLPERAEQGEGRLTARNCMSLLDALTSGWIIPLPVDVELSVDGGEVSAESELDSPVITSHHASQFGNHPEMPQAVVKFVSPWIVNAPEGVSFLVTEPMNRSESRFSTFSGMVEADKWDTQVNYPAMWEGGDFEGVLKRGTPVAQIIPFNRGSLVGDGRIRSMTQQEQEAEQRTREKVSEVDHFYRKEVWSHKNKARVVSRE